MSNQYGFVCAECSLGRTRAKLVEARTTITPDQCQLRLYCRKCGQGYIATEHPDVLIQSRSGPWTMETWALSRMAIDHRVGFFGFHRLTLEEAQQLGPGDHARLQLDDDTLEEVMVTGPVDIALHDTWCILSRPAGGRVWEDAGLHFWCDYGFLWALWQPVAR